MISGSYGFGDMNGLGGGGYPQETSGNYTTNQQGMFVPGQPQQAKIGNPYVQLNQMVQSLMKGYLRKQGGGITSAAAPNALQAMGGPMLNRYNTFGIPFSGLNPGGGSTQTGTGY